MNKLTKEQLDKCQIVLPPYNDDSTELFIPRSSGAQAKLVAQNASSFVVGQTYQIYVENYVINEPENFTLSANWNQGTKPPENKLNATIVTINGKMIRVDAIGLTTNIRWTGWLPQKAIKAL